MEDIRSVNSGAQDTNASVEDLTTRITTLESQVQDLAARLDAIGG